MATVCPECPWPVRVRSSTVAREGRRFAIWSTGVNRNNASSVVANIDPANRFANGATGRLLSWEPAAGRGRKAIPANDDRICARFCHESSVQQRVRLPGVDWVDVTARMESAPHEATMVELPVGPAYGLVLHKVQSLTMPEKVLGCLEGIFAHGQVYVLISRVTDPRNFCLIGLPPADMLDEVAEAWAANGLDLRCPACYWGLSWSCC